MREGSVIKRVLGVEKVTIESAEFEGKDLVVRVRPYQRERHRCHRCGRKCPRYDAGRGWRRWRGLDAGTVKVWLEAESPRITCPQHGVMVARVPWARHDSGFTRAFEDQAAWLTTNASQSVVGRLMRVTWRTVGRMLRRTVAERQPSVDLLDGLQRIGIDETSYRRGHRYLTVVVCHDTGRLVWAYPGNSKATLEAFLTELGEERCARLTHVTCDGAEWIHKTVASGCVNAEICMDAFHVVKWLTSAVDEVRREVWNEERKNGDTQLAGGIKGTRWALLKNPENLTRRQQEKLAKVASTNLRLYRAYLLKEQLRLLLKQPANEAIPLLDGWLSWASRSRLAPMVKIARTIRRIRPQIDAMLIHGLGNGRVESVNAKIRLIQQRAYGFRDPMALIALAKLTLSGLCPPLPGRA